MRQTPLRLADPQVRDPGYLAALHLPNVELVTDPIATVTPTGIRCESGAEHELDVLVLGTGFSTGTAGVALDIRGAHGLALAEQWSVDAARSLADLDREAQGGPQAYLGTAVAGFPNFYTLFGASQRDAS